MIYNTIGDDTSVYSELSFGPDAGKLCDSF